MRFKRLYNADKDGYNGMRDHLGLMNLGFKKPHHELKSLFARLQVVNVQFTMKGLRLPVEDI